MNWTRTWNSTLAKNFITQKPYKWVNVYLNFIGDDFITFNQAKKLWCSVKKWAKGFPVVYALIWEDEEVQWNSKFYWWRYYTVFNITDIEGLKIETVNIPVNEATILISETEKILKNYLIKEKIDLIVWEPTYSLTFDKIYIPNLNHFKNDLTEYVAVLSHEAIHSTWIKTRCNRFEKQGYYNHTFWSEDYIKEELVAELWAIILTWNRVSKNSIAYIQGCIKKLNKQENKKDIFDAFRLAQKWVDYIKQGI
jgi:antirestriction protein ArdC